MLGWLLNYTHLGEDTMRPADSKKMKGWKWLEGILASAHPRAETGVYPSLLQAGKNVNSLQRNKKIQGFHIVQKTIKNYEVEGTRKCDSQSRGKKGNRNWPSRVIWMLELVCRDLKGVIRNMFKELKENVALWLCW